MLLGENLIYLGGLEQSVDSKLIGDDNGAAFKGCVGEARIGGHLLPFFPHTEISFEKIKPRSQFRLNSTKPKEGCILCFQHDCVCNSSLTSPND